MYETTCTTLKCIFRIKYSIEPEWYLKDRNVLNLTLAGNLETESTGVLENFQQMKFGQIQNAEMKLTVIDFENIET